MRIFTIKHRGLRILAIFTIVWVMWTVAPAGGSGTAARNGTLEELLTKNISVQFRNTPIEDVLRIMADQADVDIVKSPKVKGDVTVTLTDVPLEEALNNILTVHGFNYVLSENMIRVITSEEVAEKPEILVTKTFEIVYADVAEVVKALEKFKSAKGSVSSIQGTSHIIVMDTESKVRDITLFIDKIDRMTSQVLVEARIYDITSKDSFEIDVDWTLGRNVPITEIKNTTTEVGNVGPTSTTTDTRTKTYDNLASETIPTADSTSNVVTTTSGTEGRTADTTTKSTSKSWWTDSDGDPIPYRKSKPFFGGGFDKDDGGVLRFGLLNDAVDFQFALSMLRKELGAKLLANPRILVLDNETAIFKAIREIPYQELTESSAGGSIGTTSFREVGVELEVTPHVAKADNMIRLKLKPVFSVEGEDVTVAGVGVTYPQPSVDRREVQTTLLVKSGQTVVLAGLRKKEVKEDLRKVPLLGDLPLVYKLFRYRSEEDVTSEMVVFVTTTIVEQPIMTKDMTEAEKQAYEVTKIKGP